MDNVNGRPVFETLAFKDHHARTQKVLDYFLRESITDSEYLVNATLDTKLVRDISNEVDSKVVPNFQFPIFANRDTGVLIDGRAFRDNNGNIRNLDAVGNMALEATLEYYWNTDLGRFQNVANVTSAIYGTWITSAFRERLGIDLAQQGILRCVFAFYYWTRFKSEYDMIHISEDDLEFAFYSIASGQFKAPRATIDTMWNSIGMKNVREYIMNSKKEYMYDLIKVFCSNMPDILDSPAVRTFDYSTLYNIVSGKTWLGDKSVPYTLSALEHPPTLMTMVAIVEIKQTFYKRSYIGRVVSNLKAIRISSGDITKLANEAMQDIQDL